MKIAIFENEYESVKGAFEIANFLNFNNELEFENFQSSQNANFSTIRNYSVIFVDIDLATKSDLDGFSLIQKIRKIDDALTNRIIILTGNNRIKEILIERNIYSDLISIIIKPTDFQEITKYIKKVINEIPI